MFDPYLGEPATMPEVSAIHDAPNPSTYTPLPPPPPPPTIVTTVDSTDHPDYNPDHYCDVCFKYFVRTSSLTSHRRRAHGIASTIALCVLTTECPTCHSQPTSRHELLRHLQRRPQCSLPILQTTTPISAEEYYKISPQLYKQHTALARTRIPKRGPIPTKQGKPHSQQVTAINPFIDDVT
eukprot:833580-Amphidinium_carterae.1